MAERGTRAERGTITERATVAGPRGISQGCGDRLRGGALALACVGLVACGVAEESKLPPNVQDPATLQTPSGAVARYRGALANVAGAVDRVMALGGVLTDELAALPTPQTVSGEFTAVDGRLEPSGIAALGQSSWNRLHRLRAEAREARGFLAAYAPDSSPALRGHLYAVEAYAEIWLADLFCSGIPLSTVEFDGNYTLAAGSTTSEVYRHAVTLFDSALALSSDSVTVQQLAAVGKGRALLALGQYTAAAAAVSGVPDAYSYQVPFTWGLNYQTMPDSAWLWYFRVTYTSKPGTPRVADREGQNGLDYRSSGDPRTLAVALGPTALGDTMYVPAKYPAAGPVVYTVANGLEARLIDAEAALAAAGDWLTILNALRTDGSYDTQSNPSDPSRTDTLWHAGSGGVAGLRPLADPVDPTARVDLVFRERAFWLYLTGHREGDLRRLIRQYPGHSPDQVYPTGGYPGGSGAYGAEIVVPAPASERELNSKYTGCFHRNA